MCVIVTISGGKASAWCADWALKNYPKEDVVLYFTFDCLSNNLYFSK